MYKIDLSEEEFLALIKVINRAYEIEHPSLMYHNALLKIEKRLLKQLEENISN